MKLLLYCCKAKPYLYKTEKPMIEKMNGDYHIQLNEAVLTENLNGKIVAECDFEVEKLQIVYGKGWETKTIKGTENIEKLTCLSRDELYQYCKGNGYAIHIKNLHIFDKPRELSEYFTEEKKMNTLDGYSWVCESIDRAPQNMMYAYDGEGNKYIVISIQSQWVCEILNGNKTVEVRKKVLKEMLE